MDYIFQIYIKQLINKKSKLKWEINYIKNLNNKNNKFFDN